MKDSISALGEFYGGLSGKTKDSFVDGNAKYISYLNVYNNPSVNLDCRDYVNIAKDEKQNCIKFGDVLFTGSSETAADCGMTSVVTESPKEAIYLNSFCFGYRFNDLSKINPNYIKHYFRCNALRRKIASVAYGVTRFNLSKKELGKIIISLPSETQQQKIAKYLDTFTSLITRLESELELRQKQYEHYREELLSFEGDKEVEWKTLGDVCNIMNGKDYKKEEDGEVPVYGSGGIMTYIDKAMSSKPSVLLPRKGSLNNVFYVDTPFWTVDTIYWTDIKDNTVPKYFYYYMTTINLEAMNIATGAVPSMTKAILNKIVIPVPKDPHRQQQIVDKLDMFEQLIAALKREIALRKKQYTYYREKLLTFE